MRSSHSSIGGAVVVTNQDSKRKGSSCVHQTQDSISKFLVPTPSCWTTTKQNNFDFGVTNYPLFRGPIAGLQNQLSNVGYECHMLLWRFWYIYLSSIKSITRRLVGKANLRFPWVQGSLSPNQWHRKVHSESPILLVNQRVAKTIDSKWLFCSNSIINGLERVMMILKDCSTPTASPLPIPI